MAHRTSTFGAWAASGLEGMLTLKRASLMTLGLALLALVVILALAIGSVVRPQTSAGVVAGVEASAARWSALGEYF